MATAGCAMTLGACGGGEVHAASRATTSGPTPAIPLATFNCAEWLVSPAGVHRKVLDELHAFYGRPISGKRRTQGYGTVLTDAQATLLFDTYCRQPFARNFTVYKLYARAAAFGGRAP